MLHLYQSNRLGSASKLLLQVTDMPLADALAPERLIVQSKGMGRWLGFELARQQGIAANLQVELPASFIWGLMRDVLGDLPAGPATARRCWCGGCWPGWIFTRRNFPRLAGYLESGDAKRRYQLASRIASIYDHAAPEQAYQLEREGYFCADSKLSSPEHLGL